MNTAGARGVRREHTKEQGGACRAQRCLQVGTVTISKREDVVLLWAADDGGYWKPILSSVGLRFPLLIVLEDFTAGWVSPVCKRFPENGKTMTQPKSQKILVVSCQHIME